MSIAAVQLRREQESRRRPPIGLLVGALPLLSGLFPDLIAPAIRQIVAAYHYSARLLTALSPAQCDHRRGRRLERNIAL
jgi:hypothetical protein